MAHPGRTHVVSAPPSHYAAEDSTLLKDFLPKSSDTFSVQPPHGRVQRIPAPTDNPHAPRYRRNAAVRGGTMSIALACLLVISASLLSGALEQRRVGRAVQRNRARNPR